MFSIYKELPRLANYPAKEVKQYFQWFLSIIPERLQALTAAVTGTPGYEEWKADFSPESLVMLNAWFVGQVELRKLSPEERAALAAMLPYPFDVPEYDLAERTFGAAHDVGIYFAEVFRHQYPFMQWVQEKGGKRNIDYGRAVLSGFGRAPLNPVTIVIVVARKISDKTNKEQELRSLYDVWSRYIEH